jgi:hypothetical protein
MQKNGVKFYKERKNTTTFAKIEKAQQILQRAKKYTKF